MDLNKLQNEITGAIDAAEDKLVSVSHQIRADFGLEQILEGKCTQITKEKY